MMYILRCPKGLPWLPSAEILYLFVVLSNTRLADLNVLFVVRASSTDSVVDIFGLNVFRQRSERTLTE
jgi:hypothetical protein